MALSAEIMLGRFRGSMLGALVGDCLGAPFEGDRSVAFSVLNNYIRKLADPKTKVPYKRYTDDTAMMRSVAQTLIDKKEYDSLDLAKKFTKVYFEDRGRGYGGAVPMVFTTLKATKFKDIFAPAAVLFEGSGSFGNGGGMRVAPVALFTANSTDEVTSQIARDSTMLTHTNPLGYNGAILECLAVKKALATPPNTLEPQTFVDSLITSMKNLHNPHEEDQSVCADTEGSGGYVDKLLIVKKLLAKEDVKRDEVVDKLGHDVSAIRSIPTAIYVFLRTMQPIEEIEHESEVIRSVLYSISLGGDTDTIATMSAAIAGAYYGCDNIPKFLGKHCEGWKHAITQATNLHSLVYTTD